MLRSVLVIAVMMVLVAALLRVAPRIPLLSWMGRLPGDFRFDTANGRFHFPLATCVVLSLLIQLLLKSLRFLIS